MATGPYADRRWRKLRLIILQRDGYRCQIQRKGCRGTANAVDHIIDWRDGGAWFDPPNLRACCKPCNTGQRNQRVAQRARTQRAQTTTPTHSRAW